MSNWDRIADLPDGDQQREVYARAGLALYSAQAWERGMITLALLAGLTRGRYGTVIDWDSDEAALTSLTAGKLRQRLTAEGLVDHETLESWSETLKGRNFLAHRFFYEHAVDFMTVEGMQRMVDGLDALRLRFETADAEVTNLCRDLRIAIGVGDEQVTAMQEELVQQARSQSGNPKSNPAGNTATPDRQ